MNKYSKMIDNLDSFDVFVFKRTQGSSSDKEVEKFLRAAVVDFDEMMKASGIPAATATSAESTPTQSLQRRYMCEHSNLYSRCVFTILMMRHVLELPLTEGELFVEPSGG